MKLCYIANPNSTHTKRWLDWFHQRGHTVSLVADVAAEEEWRGIPVYNLPARINTPVIKYAFWEIWTRQLIKRLQPDILHAHRVSSAGWLGAYAGFHPFIVTPWGSDLYTHPLRSQAARRLARYVLKQADFVTADSEDLRQTAILYGARPEKSQVIQWGVDFSLFNPEGDVNWLRKDLDLTGSPIIFSPRGLNPIYNIDTIISTIPQVRKAIPGAIFILRDYNTDPAYKNQILALIDTLQVAPAIRWVGRVEPWPRIADYYRLADLVVSVPSSDGTPVSVLETMACGVAVVASKLPSLVEWIDDGVNGCLVPVRDAARLSDAIIQLLKDTSLRQGYAQRSLSLVRQRADQDSEMAKMEAIYSMLAENKA